MLIRKGNRISIVTLFKDELLTLLNSLDWYVWMKQVRDLSDSTIKVFMKAMERFWIWSLYNPIEISEAFHVYQAKYRADLRNGYEISITNKDEEFDYEIKFIVSKSQPLSKSTINKEIAGINSYFYFVDESKLIEDNRFVNLLYERHKSANGFLAGIQIKKSSLVLEAFGKKIKYLPPYKLPRNRDAVKYFPLNLFDELLTIAKPRERLIYLLCGVCSARIGQALNLTLYDIDYDKKDVWLLDPKGDSLDVYGNKRRVWLKEEYTIDMLDPNEIHNTDDLQFKYPIPLHHSPLFWLNEKKYKELFFSTLKEYTQSKTFVTESTRFPSHPFMFVTSTGKRVHQKDTLTRFKTNLRKLSQKFPEYKKNLMG